MRERFQRALTLDAGIAAQAATQRQGIGAALDEMLAGALLCIPKVTYAETLEGSVALEKNRPRALLALAVRVCAPDH
jgi:hypothetical protein